EQASQRTPEDGVRQADKVQGDENDGAVADIYHQLQPEITADPIAGFVHSLRHYVQMAVTAQPNQTVPQTFPLEQHEKCEDNYQKYERQRLQEAVQRIHARGCASHLLDSHGPLRRSAQISEFAPLMMAGGGGMGDAELLAQMLHFMSGAREAGVLGGMEQCDFVGDVDAVGGQVAGYLNQLIDDRPPDGAGSAAEHG